MSALTSISGLILTKTLGNFCDVFDAEIRLISPWYEPITNLDIPDCKAE